SRERAHVRLGHARREARPSRHVETDEDGPKQIGVVRLEPRVREHEAFLAGSEIAAIGAQGARRNAHGRLAARPVARAVVDDAVAVVVEAVARLGAPGMGERVAVVAVVAARAGLARGKPGEWSPVPISIGIVRARAVDAPDVWFTPIVGTGIAIVAPKGCQRAHARDALGGLARRRGTVRRNRAANQLLAREAAARATTRGQRHREQSEHPLEPPQVHTPYPSMSVSPHNIPR